MLTGDFFYYQPAFLRLATESRHGHATLRKRDLDRPIEAEWSIQTNAMRITGRWIARRFLRVMRQSNFAHVCRLFNARQSNAVNATHRRDLT